jgi:hypothetical protein
LPLPQSSPQSFFVKLSTINSTHDHQRNLTRRGGRWHFKQRESERYCCLCLHICTLFVCVQVVRVVALHHLIPDPCLSSPPFSEKLTSGLAKLKNATSTLLKNSMTLRGNGKLITCNWASTERLAVISQRMTQKMLQHKPLPSVHQLTNTTDQSQYATRTTLLF